MKKRYPAKLFVFFVLTNFLFHFFYLLIPGLIFSVVGIWSRPCLWIGLAILCLDFILSIVEQVKICKAALTPSGNPEFDNWMGALCSSGGLAEFGKLVDEKIRSVPAVEMDKEQN